MIEQNGFQIWNQRPKVIPKSSSNLKQQKSCPPVLLLPFQDKLCDTLTDLENSNLNYIVCGDINVNFFAKDNEKITNYVNNLAMIRCKMKINNHTRFGENCRPSLLDHTYTNSGNTRTNNGVALLELSDHLPTFFNGTKHHMLC